MAFEFISFRETFGAWEGGEGVIDLMDVTETS